ncbi:subtilisin-like protease 4 [Dioscorea cayenensis subsp. rotundata]|uniref:Subtilisin-like protease 4 n=1 Tax=Dioscorea cayennensis subsp. rotundata TaxID=55577 RepID=A0AB40C0V9_DIOCR|nr:subtilisin-like protease 4 [Dioscorea cayenensis subsp. rotundata]
MAPRAFISVYKNCWIDIGFPSVDVIAGIDQAIQDGVDILQMSIVPKHPLPDSFSKDDVAIGTYSAMQKDIFPCVAVGNNGPSLETLGCAAPWDMVVGATTIDRRIRVTGNGQQFHGESAYQPNIVTNKFLPLIFPGSNGQIDQLICRNNSLNGINVRGKIVMCYAMGRGTENIEKGDVVKNAGGVGMIIMNLLPDGFITYSTTHHLPVSRVSYIDSLQIEDYIATNSTPIAKITFGGAIFGTRPALALAYFSSRGPTKYNGNIVKPDVIAPGVNILSAWTAEVGPFPLV